MVCFYIFLGITNETVHAEVFYGCKNLTDIRLGENVETIGANAFTGCVKVKSLTLPAKVKKSVPMRFMAVKN